MKILIYGSGGREHAIAYQLNKSKRVEKLWCAPGNGGIAEVAECFPNVKATDLDAAVKLAKELNPDMIVVAPDDPLIMGLTDLLEAEGFKVFGPRKNAAIIEGSKEFSKKLMQKYNIPTAKYKSFTDYKEAVDYINSQPVPIVVKADGPALGKGVTVAETREEAIDAVKASMEDKIFGASGSCVVIEECLTGPEVSVLAFTDGKTMVPMVSSKDHKRAYDNDKGPNTGGMGTISPNPFYNDELAKECMETIFLPTMKAMNEEGRTFKGVLYFGLMITPNGPKVIEYNCRFGDPETQVVLPRLKTDLVDIFEAVINENLADINIEWSDDACACVIMASGGYPKSYEKGYEISGLDNLCDCCVVYHAGTALKDGKIVTAGGRVLGVTCKGKTLDEALSRCYANVNKISFEKGFYRTDIGKTGCK